MPACSLVHQRLILAGSAERALVRGRDGADRARIAVRAIRTSRCSADLALRADSGALVRRVIARRAVGAGRETGLIAEAASVAERAFKTAPIAGGRAGGALSTLSHR